MRARKSSLRTSMGTLLFIAAALVLVFSVITIAANLIAAGEKETMILRSQGCNSESSGNNPQTFTGACTGTYPSQVCGVNDDRLSCNDGIEESATQTNGKWAGANVSVYNATLNNCDSIVSVRVCYNWRQAATYAVSPCQIGTHDGNAVWTTNAIGCPSAAASNLTCIDVTANEPWQCSSFFGSSGSKAGAMIEMQKSGGGTGTVLVDALYFNVTYFSDDAAPNISVLAPLPGRNVSGVFMVNASVNDTSTVLRANLTIYNNTGNATGTLKMTLGAGTATAGYWNVTIDSTALRDGIYNLSVNATDNAVLKNAGFAANVSITIDNTAPNATIVVPLNNTNISQNFLINASVNDSVSGVFNATFMLFNNTHNVTEWIYATRSSGSLYQGYWNTTATVASIPDGYYNITVNATDFAGNQKLVNISSVTIDKTPANVTIVVPLNNTNTTADILINASVNDSLSKVLNVTFRLVNYLYASGWLYSDRSSGTIAAGYWNATATAASIADGRYNITINATDYAGNQKLVNISSFAIDRQAPNATIMLPLNNTNFSQNFLINASVNDSVTGVFNATFMLYNNTHNVTEWLYATRSSGSATAGYWNTTAAVAALPDGYYNVTVNATDYNGNQFIANISSIIVDRTSSNVTAILPYNDTNFTADFMVNASVNDSVTGIFNATFRLINSITATSWIYAERSSGSIYSGYWNATVAVSTVNDGFYNITVNATDFAGNQKLVNISSFAIDRQAPNISGITPLNFSNFTGSFLINASVNDSVTTALNVTFIFINWEGSSSTIKATLGAGTTTAGYWNATPSLAGISDGFYNITANATDLVGNSRIVNMTAISIDRAAPNATIATPVNVSNYSNDFLINASVNDSTSKVFNATFMLFNNTHNVTGWIYATRNSGSIAAGYWNATAAISGLNDGTYNITINATDFAGNQFIANISRARIDRSRPNASAAAPANGTIVTGVIAISASVNDTGSGMRAVEYRLINESSTGSWISASLNTGTIAAGYWNINLDTRIVLNGNYNITVNATDFAGNQYVSNMSWLLIDNIQDFANPNASITFPASGKNISGDFLVNASINDTDGSVAEANVTLYNNTGNATARTAMTLNAGTTVSGYWSAIISSAQLMDGTYNISVTTIDLAGNKNISGNVSVIIDNTPPNASAVAPANNTIFTSGSILVNASVNDTFTKVFNATFRLTNEYASTSWIYAERSSGSTTSGYWNATISALAVPSGTYNITINATDYAGSQRLSNISQIKIDRVAPNVSIFVPLNSTNLTADFLINASVNDSVSNVFNATFRLMNSLATTEWLYASRSSGTIAAGYWNTTAVIAALPDGKYNITVNSTDFAGNQNIVNISEIAIDRASPNVSLAVPYNNSNYTSDFVINVSVNDSVTGVFNATFRLMNSITTTSWIYAERSSGSVYAGYWNGTVVTAGLPDGRYNITVNATDFAGNQKLVNISNVAIDRQAPNATIIAPANNTNLTSNFLINASVNDSVTGVFNASFRIINQLVSTEWLYATRSSGSVYAGYWNTTADASSLADGYYNITINATDYNGNQFIANISSMIIDRAAPNASLISPQNNTNFSQNFLINASVNDSLSKVFNATFRLMNSLTTTNWINANLSSGSAVAGYWNATATAASIADGKYNITVNATDFAGNQKLVNITEITLDKTMPNASIITPLNNSNFSDDFLINASVNDSLSTIFNASFRLINEFASTSWIYSNMNIGNTATGYWNSTFAAASVADGRYNITINVTDFAGNQIISNISRVTIDKISPNVTAVGTANGSIVANATMLNASVNDSVSGVSLVLYRLTSANGLTVTNWVTAQLRQGNAFAGYWNATFDTRTVANGDYNITVNATDYAGSSRIINMSMITISNDEIIAAGENEAVLLMAQSCNREDSVIGQTFPLSCAGTYPAACPSDALSCNDATSETSVLSSGEFGGVNITSYNSTIKNCILVKTVRLCYEWSVTAADSYSSCTVGIDKAGDFSWSTTSVVCPTTTADLLKCVDITSFEASWSCPDFFSASTNTRAYIEAQRISGGGTRNINIDAFYFNVTYTRDTVKPENAVISPRQNGNISGNFRIIASVNDTVGVEKANLTIYNSTGNVTTPIPMSIGAGNIVVGWWNATFNFANLREGRYNLSVNASDTSGNINISDNISILVDNTLSNASGITPLNNTNFSQNFLINASVNDSLSKVFNATFRLVNPAATTGWIYATLTTGSIAAGYWNATAIAASITDGKYNITVNATDFAGNQKLVNISEVTVDTTKPNATIIAPLNRTNTTIDFLINASVNDSTSKVFNATFRLMNSITTTSWIYAERSSGTITAGYWNATFAVSAINDGRYNITINATDYANNQLMANISEVRVDRTAPNASITTPINHTNATTAMLINASVNDSVAGIFNASFRLINELASTDWLYSTIGAGDIYAGWWNATFDTATLSDGTYNITINATDFAGNQRISNITTVTIDTTFPNASIIAPVNGTNLSAEFLVNASVNDSLTGISNVSFRLSKNSYFSNWHNATRPAGTIYAGYWNVTINSSLFADGIYNITINATDFAGNQKLANISQLFIDNNVPLIALNLPVQDGNTTNLSINFSWTVQDGDPWVACNLTIDGKTNMSDIESNSGEITNYTVFNFNDNLHRWNVTCMDHSGNTNSSSTTRNLTIVKGPEFINASLLKDNATVMLNWSNVTYADSFAIYISDRYNYFAATPNFTGIRDINWTDNATNATAKMFYKVAAVRGLANKTSEEAAGRHVIQFQPGWNMVSLPLNIIQPRLWNKTLEGYDLAARPEGCVNEIWRYNSTLQDPWEFTQRQDNWTAAAGDENFTTLEANRGYWMYNNIAAMCNITIAGILPQLNSTAGLQSDFNLIGWTSEDNPTLPSNCVGGYPFEVTPANSITQLYYYNASTSLFYGTWHYTYSGCPNNDWGWWPDSRSSHFTKLTPTLGYYAKASQENLWSIDPLR